MRYVVKAVVVLALLIGLPAFLAAPESTAAMFAAAIGALLPHL